MPNIIFIKLWPYENNRDVHLPGLAAVELTSYIPHHACTCIHKCVCMLYIVYFYMLHVLVCFLYHCPLPATSFMTTIIRHLINIQFIVLNCEKHWYHYYLISHVLLSLSYGRPSDKFCQSLKRNLPKLAGKLKSLILLDVQFNDHLREARIVHVLNSSLIYYHCKMSSTDFDNITTAIATSKLKQFGMSNWPISSVWGESLAKLLRQSKTLEQVTVSTEQHYECYRWQCNVIRLLIKAMTHGSVKRLVLILRIKCNCDFSDIPYDRDKVKISYDP